ncbi:hypothetical protein [Alteribacillus sp. HJP-4]
MIAFINTEALTFTLIKEQTALLSKSGAAAASSVSVKEAFQPVKRVY